MSILGAAVVAVGSIAAAPASAPQHGSIGFPHYAVDVSVPKSPEFLTVARAPKPEPVKVAAVAASKPAAKPAPRPAQRQAAQAPRSRTATASVVHTVNVWTAGFQAQINACRGGVDLTAHYGVRTVGEAWGCGGASFPAGRGASVRLTGLDAGTYRVLGVVAVLNAYVANTSQVPRGYQLLFQTCRGNNAHYTEFIALARVS
jgi:hypothetical protein